MNFEFRWVPLGGMVLMAGALPLAARAGLEQKPIFTKDSVYALDFNGPFKGLRVLTISAQVDATLWRTTDPSSADAMLFKILPTNKFQFVASISPVKKGTPYREIPSYVLSKKTDYLLALGIGDYKWRRDMFFTVEIGNKTYKLLVAAIRGTGNYLYAMGSGDGFANHFGKNAEKTLIEIH